MEKVNWKDIINLGIISVVIVCFIFLVMFIPVRSQEKREMCRFGNITLDMDSATAVKYLDKQRIRFEQQTECVIPLENKGDSIGYSYSVYGKKCESFYITLKDNKVYKIWFRSNSLTSKDVLTIHNNETIYLKGKPFKHVGEDFTFEYDGKNTYSVIKNN